MLPIYRLRSLSELFRARLLASGSRLLTERLILENVVGARQYGALIIRLLWLTNPNLRTHFHKAPPSIHQPLGGGRRLDPLLSGVLRRVLLLYRHVALNNLENAGVLRDPVPWLRLPSICVLDPIHY